MVSNESYIDAGQEEGGFIRYHAGSVTLPN